MGARPLSRKIDELIRVPLSKKILFERLDNCYINAVMIDNKIDFTIIPSDPLPMVDNNGIIVLGNASPQV
jgi:hypothetical protein